MNIKNCKIHGMTRRESVALEQFAEECKHQGDVLSLSGTLIMISRWMQQKCKVSFTEYAGQWTEAHREGVNTNHSTPKMATFWPFTGRQCIQHGGWYYSPCGVGAAICNEETEVRHAISIILAEFPDFNCDGLNLYGHNSVWEHPVKSPDFIKQAISCLAWIKSKKLMDCQTVYFSGKNATSYGLKHHIEQVNKANHQKNDSTEDPCYISNGALIAAMVAAGYRIQRSGPLSCRFNISHKALRRAISEDLDVMYVHA